MVGIRIIILKKFNWNNLSLPTFSTQSNKISWQTKAVKINAIKNILTPSIKTFLKEMLQN
jgi:hypothetical protein